MADNVAITAGSGTTIAADEVTRNATSEKQQVVKIGVGAEGEHVGFFCASDIYRNLDIDETGQNVKASAGLVFGIHAFNVNASARYLKLYNKASAPTVGTDTPVMTFQLPQNVPTEFMVAAGIEFDTGIGIGCTTGIGDSDTGAPGANDVVVNLFYK